MNALLAAATALATIAIDQWSKREARRRGQFTRNPRGAAGGAVLFAALSATIVWILVSAPGLPRPAATGFGLALGGAASNLADRRFHGGVIDFIRIGRWPSFNIADAALTAAIPVCALALLP